MPSVILLVFGATWGRIVVVFRIITVANPAGGSWCDGKRVVVGEVGRCACLLHSMYDVPYVSNNGVFL